MYAKVYPWTFQNHRKKNPSPWGFAFKMTRICFWFRKNTTGAGPLGASHQAADSFDRDEAFPRKRTVGDVGTWYVFVQKKDLKDVHPWKLTSNHWFSGDMLVFGGVTDVFRVFMYVYLEPFDDPGISPSCFAWSLDLVLEGEEASKDRKNPSQWPPRLKHAIIVGPWSREKILQVANWRKPLGSHQSWTWNCWIWIL